MYQQAGYQNGFSHGPNYSGPPPAKKAKSGPVITRYAPPPGYQRPPPSQPYYRPPGFIQPAYPGYQPQQYAPPPSYQQQWPGYQQPSFPATGFPPAPEQFQAPPAPPAQYSTTWQSPASAPTIAPPQPRQPPPSDASLKRRHNSAPYPHTRMASIGPLDGNGEPLPPPDLVTHDDDSLEAHFVSECYFARHPDEIDPDLSLGQIVWHPPLPTKLALPATFAEAELEALAPRNPRPVDEESISDYFTRAKCEESLLSVRQTELWPEVKDDVIFRELPLICSHILTMSELYERYRDRPDPEWNGLSAVRTASQTPQMSRQQTPAPNHTENGSSYAGADAVKFKSEDSVDHDDILDNFEQALLANGHDSGQHWNSRPGTAAIVRSRAASTSSTAGEKITRPKPLAPIRDIAQENILAALGVTGSPKMVYQTPGPAFGAPTAQSNGIAYANGRERTNSLASRRTNSACEIKTEDMDVTPRPKMDSRKRSHGEFEHGDRKWEADETTPRQLKQARVD